MKCMCVCVGHKVPAQNSGYATVTVFPAELYIALVLTIKELDTASIAMAIAIALQYDSLIFRLTILIVKC